MSGENVHYVRIPSLINIIHLLLNDDFSIAGRSAAYGRSGQYCCRPGLAVDRSGQCVPTLFRHAHRPIDALGAAHIIVGVPRSTP